MKYGLKLKAFILIATATTVNNCFARGTGSEYCSQEIPTLTPEAIEEIAERIAGETRTLVGQADEALAAVLNTLHALQETLPALAAPRSGMEVTVIETQLLFNISIRFALDQINTLIRRIRFATNSYEQPLFVATHQSTVDCRDAAGRLLNEIGNLTTSTTRGDNQQIFERTVQAFAIIREAFNARSEREVVNQEQR